MKLVVSVLALLIAAIGLAGVVSPSLLLDVTSALLTPGALYGVALARIVFGVLLFWVATVSRAPTTLRIIGVVVAIAGLVTPFFGVERSRAVFEWWSQQPPLFMRALAAVAIAFGVFIIYALMPRRRRP